VVPVVRSAVSSSDPAPAPEVRISGRTWTATAADAFTVLLWPGDRAQPGWEDLVERVRLLVASRATVVEPRYSEGPLADALGSKAVLVVVRPDGYLHATVDPAGAAALPAALDAARSGQDPLSGKEKTKK
jgi:hypothetical protein